jgi:hypothetical protein
MIAERLKLESPLFIAAAFAFFRCALPILLCAMLLATITIHWLAFRPFGLPLPMARTALFFAPLFTLFLAALAGAPTRVGGAAVLRTATVAWFAVAGIYFIGCLRLSYFQEWKFDADSKAVYLVLNDLNLRQPIGSVYADWIFVPCLNFYNLSYGGKLPRFEHLDFPLPRPLCLCSTGIHAPPIH